LAQERALLRGKLRERHNKTHELEEKCGVRIGSVVNLLKRDESHQKDDLFLDSLIPASGVNQRHTIDFSNNTESLPEKRR
jgi:hypothetical protein